MRVEAVTKYRCDGCSKEDQCPSNWVTIRPRVGTSQSYPVDGMITDLTQSEDYCFHCMALMRRMLKSHWVNT